MQHKDKILNLINEYAATCGGDPDGADPQAKAEILAKITELLTAPKHIEEAVEMLDGYLMDRSQEQMKTGLISGAEGNMMFKLNQIKDFLNIK